MIYILLFFYEAFVCFLADRKHYSDLNSFEISNGKFKIFPQKIIVALFISIPMICVMGLRYEIGVDYHTYESIFQWIRLYNSRSGMEYLYYVLNRCIGQLTDNPQWLFFIVSVLINFLLVKGVVKNGGSLYYGILCFMGLGYWFYSMNGQRQYVACMITFLGWKYFEQKKLKKFLPYIIVAMLFHSSAIIWIAIYALLKFVRGKRFYYVSFIIIFSMMMLKKVTVSILHKLNFYSGYLSMSGSPSWVNIIISGSFIIALGILYNNLVQIREENEIRIKLVWFCFLSHLFLWSYGYVAMRMLIYIYPVYMLLLSDIVRCFSAKTRRIIQIGMCVLLCCFMIIIVTYSGNASQHFLPYRYRTL